MKDLKLDCTWKTVCGSVFFYHSYPLPGLVINFSFFYSYAIKKNAEPKVLLDK